MLITREKPEVPSEIGLAHVGTLAGLPETLTPRLLIAVGGIATIGARDYVVERRLGEDRWQFIGIEDREPVFSTDAELVRLQAEGKFFVRDRADPAKHEPLSPIVVGAKMAERNIVKWAYVKACLDMGDGFRRSRETLGPVIEDVAQQREERAPRLSTILAWYDLYRKFGATFGLAALSDRNDCKGRRGSRLLAFQDRAIEIGLARYLKGGTVLRAYSAVERAVRLFDRLNGRHFDKEALGNRYVDDTGRLKPPSQRTFERRVERFDPIMRDLARKGERYIRQRYRTYQTMPRPDQPYAEVEVDHGIIDLLVIDESGLVFGRPCLTVFRDRATGMILGYSIGFEGPCYAAFLQALRHAIYPKDLSPFPKVTNPWPCYGRIGKLFVDNGLEFIGRNIEGAGRDLNFSTTILPPRHPWLKGEVERFFRSANVGLIHDLPATTLSNVLERRDYETLGKATLTIDEFESLFVFWVCQIYHAGKRRGLGVIRGLGDQPLRVWAEKVKEYQTPPLPHPDLFMSLAGDRAYGTIQKNGVQWDYLIYQSDDLDRFLADPRHKFRSDGTSTKYEVVRDPNDLSHITVISPFDGTKRRIPTTLAHRKYATRRTLHQHQVILRHAKARVGKAINIDELHKSADELAAAIEGLRKHPSQKTLHKRLARFLNENKLRHLKSEMAVPEPESGPASDYADLTPPPQTHWDAEPADPPAQDHSTRAAIAAPNIAVDDEDDLVSGPKWELSYD